MEIETLAEGKYLRLVRAGRWEYVERKSVNGVVIIVPFLDGGRLLLIEQYRRAVDAACIEFPAGLSGDSADAADEALAVAAARELVEETGYEAGELRFLGLSSASAGMTSETASYFAATGLRRVGAGGGVDNERITSHEVVLADVRGWLEQQSRRAVVSATVYAGLYLAGCQ